MGKGKDKFISKSSRLGGGGGGGEVELANVAPIVDKLFKKNQADFIRKHP